MTRRNIYYNGPASENFDGLRFFNRDGPVTDRGLRDILRWQTTARRVQWPERVAVEQVTPAARIPGLRATLVGHATVLVQMGGVNILTDPLWSERASPLSFAGARRVTPPAIAMEALPEVDLVVLSHNHYDHLDVETLRKLHERFAMPIVTPLGNDTIVRRYIPDAKIFAGNWDDRFEVAGTDVHLVPAHHWSARTLRDRRMALWSGFMIRNTAGLVYFAGDTGYGDGEIFRAMQRQFGSPDLALIPIGAYEPRWFMAAQHIDPNEAVQVMLDLQARQAMGIHWGTFKLTDEGREEPAEQLQLALARHGISAERFVAAVPGSVVDCNSELAKFG